MDADFERLKIITEKELGRELDADEEHYLKALFYFGKGVKLKAQVKAASEPERIGLIAERVLQDIEGRIERQRRRGIVAAVGDFLSGKSKPGEQAGKKKTEQKQLW